MLAGVVTRIVPSASKRSSRIHWLWQLAGDSGAVFGGLTVLIMALLGLIGPYFTGYDVLNVDPMNRLLPPSSEHWMGTDGFGRDMLTRVLYGARVSLFVGMATMVFSTVLGAVVGLIAGYFKSVDGPIMRIMDGFMAFPSILLAIAIMASLGPRTENVIAALTIVNLPRIARLVRGQVLVVRELLYVEAARAIGATNWRIIFKHTLPNSISPLIVQGSFTFAFAVITEASLSYLGAGVPAEIPTWGNQLQEGVPLMAAAAWMSVFPGLAITITVLGLNQLGDGLRDSLDPRIQEA
ncbi:MAG: ABC transporter permease [Chloroflexota bacterium]